MGIKLLNRFLREKCKTGINEITIASLEGKKIAIDISIYLYRGKENGELFSNIYFMCSLFRYYNIHPIFVFDGKPPLEKKMILEKRKDKKREAANLCKQMLDKLDTIVSIEKKRQYIKKIKILQKKSTRIKYLDIQTIKELFDCYGITYIIAPGEADVMCAQLVIQNEAYACLSEDTDLFVYGCPRVLRYFSFIHQTVVLYDLSTILHNNLHMSLKDFKDICIASGTDYNTSNHSIYYYYTKFLDFKKSLLTINFHDWVHHESLSNINHIKKLFEIPSKHLFLHIQNKKIQHETLSILLKKNNFMFID